MEKMNLVFKTYVTTMGVFLVLALIMSIGLFVSPESMSLDDFMGTLLSGFIGATVFGFIAGIVVDASNKKE